MLPAVLALLLSGAAGAADTTAPQVACLDRQITVSAARVTLDELLTVIARECHVAIRTAGAAQRIVSADFFAEDFERAMRRLLRGQSYVLSYDSARPGADNWLQILDDAGVAPDGGWLIPPGDPEAHGDALEAIYLLAETAADTRLGTLRTLLTAADTTRRMAAVETLAEIGGDDAVMLLASALYDTDHEVREAAADALGQIGGVLAARELRRHTGDPDPVVRLAVADNLEEIDTTTRRQGETND